MMELSQAPMMHPMVNTIADFARDNGRSEPGSVCCWRYDTATIAGGETILRNEVSGKSKQHKAEKLQFQLR